MVGGRISDWLRYKGRRPAWLARETRLSTSAIAQIQENKINPSLESLGRIVGALGITMEQFWGDVPAVKRAAKRPKPRKEAGNVR